MGETTIPSRYWSKMFNIVNSLHWRICSWADFFFYIPPSPWLLCTFTQWLQLHSCAFCLFHPVWPFSFPASPRSHQIRRFRNCDISLWPLLCFLSSFSYSLQRSGKSLTHFLKCTHSLCLIAIFLQEFTMLSLHLWCILLHVSVSLSNPFMAILKDSESSYPAIYTELMHRKTQVPYLFYHWG